jgi:pyruvate formate lyase activating enzyme
VVYLKGCHLECPWCHNIEGKSFEPEFSIDEKRCIARTVNDKACTIDCPVKDNKPASSSDAVYARIVGVCPSKAVKLVGRDYTVDALVEELMKDTVFLKQTNGGVTFSGGEPMAQHEFLFACADALRSKGIHLAMETSGFWSGGLAKDVIKRLDFILFDLKHADPGKYKRFIGIDNKVVLGNLVQLLGSDIEVELRITLVPGFNDSDDDIKVIADFIKTLNPMPAVRLLLFHRLAVSKQALFRRAYSYAQTPVLSVQRLSEVTSLFRDQGIAVCR